jgi:hypothetical protein
MVVSDLTEMLTMSSFLKSKLKEIGITDAEIQDPYNIDALKLEP